ncbi:Cobalt-precorrin-4 C11-methyltransferase [Prochlorococcus marinus str. MIT 9201]|uniref:Cobalt-precorrin-4 C11-methyltransferase n=1 Tax=Prochlorococcus marinus str. MIT 9201 TaxID=93057 RepID=A0A0A2ABV8_PROMR|nr:precorrin-4 C(11)-methyltransferase [Prochlorococcus marinus]KGF97898.1 Cobalt-precorrin-4 C11-methyltransferase [Prochlorococcus marinus str. MIT 9201]
MDKKISFIGVGPGDPDLLTLKALKKIKIADVIIWTDSLIPEKILDFSKEGSEKIKTSSLNLEQITSIMIKKIQEGKNVTRLHDGDPCLFGAIREQIEILKKEEIEIEVIPGVSAFQVAAAYHEAELTIPDVTQTIILTRAGGRTGMPEKESLKDLAKHNSSLCLYLSARHVKRSQETLLEFYPQDTKVIVGYRVSWDDGWTSLIELKDMENFSIEKKLIRTTIYIISPAINHSQNRSNLYNPAYRHLFRNK